jgi:hypothetical protein
MPRRLLVLAVRGDESQPVYGLVNDISDSGAGIVADRLLPSGRGVQIRICFYPQVCFDTEARVVWGRDSLDPRQRGHGLALNGVRFAGPLDPLMSAGGILRSHRRSYQDSVLAESLEYLEYRIPDYPFDPGVDKLFIAELLSDFPDVDLLEEIKTFRWSYDNNPIAGGSNPRVALRRWVSSANTSRATMMNGNWRANGGSNGRNAAAFLSKETFGSWVSFLKA